MFVYTSQVCRLKELFTDSIFAKVIKNLPTPNFRVKTTAKKYKLNSKYTDSLLFLYFYRQRDNYGGKNDIGKTGT